MAPFFLLAFLLVKLLAVSFAAYNSVRARFFPGIGAIATMAYLTAARAASVLPSFPSLPLRDVLAQTWWIYPVAMLALSLGPMIFAFRTAGDLPSDEPRQKEMERTAMAFLGNVLLDTALLLIVIFAMVLTARDA